MSRGETGRFRATVETDTDRALGLWEAMVAEGGACLPFQRRAWLEAWFETCGRRVGIEILPVTIRDRADKPVAGLPLVRESRQLRRIGFADGGLADYNGPVLSREAPQDRSGAAALWAALIAVLPPAAVVRLERMPRQIGGRVNPFSLLPAALASPAAGLVLDLPGLYDGWRAALPRRYRMELGRCSRLFDALPGARYRRVDGDDREPALEALEHLQRARIAALGLPYLLDEPDARALYRTLARGDRDHPGVLTVLEAEGRVIAALFGLRFGSCFLMLRIGADEACSRLSPARLLITRTMETLSAEGVDTFDLGLGDYAYKRKLGGAPLALVDVVSARSPLGLADWAGHRLRAGLRTSPRAAATARRLRDLVHAPRFGPTTSA